MPNGVIYYNPLPPPSWEYRLTYILERIFWKTTHSGIWWI